jgi:hypothetical protein
MKLALMKMVVVGLEKVDMIWEIMVTDVGGQGWVVDLMMVLLNGLKRGGRKVTGLDTKS